jgi:integrase
MAQNRSLHAELTVHLVSTAEPPESGQRFIRDSEISGFALRITSAGTKSYIVECWVNGRSRRKTLGKHPALSIKDARRQAKQEIGRFAQGRDTVVERRAEKAKSVTLEEAFAAYVSASRLKPTTLKDYRYTVRTAFEDWLRKPITSISCEMIERRYKVLGERSEARANISMRVLRAIFNYASERYRDDSDTPLLAFNPVSRALRRGWFKVPRKQTRIQDKQLPAWFAAVNGLTAKQEDGRAGAARDYLIFLLLTGVRRAEGQGLRWSEVNLEDRTFRLLDTKNGTDHELPLPDYLAAVLQRRRVDAAPGEKYVFAEGGAVIADPRYWISKVTGESGVRFALHDLRRTFATIAESLDISVYALKRLLNHSTDGNDVTQGYVAWDVERLRPPMQRIEDRILELACVENNA